MKPGLLPAAPVESPSVAGAGEEVLNRSIGDLLRTVCHWSEADVERVLAHQRLHRVRFGAAAQALGLATADDVLWALSQQYHYPYGGESEPELVVAANPFSAEAESFRELRSQLMMGVFAPGEPRRALAVISPDVGDGKSYVAANLAAALSQLGERTLLVDADLRTPRLHRLLRVPVEEAPSGLSGMLAGRPELNAIHEVPQLPSLYLLPAGAIPPNPLELVQRAAFGLLLHELAGKFDHVVVDTPAGQHGADARVIAVKCGAALIVGRQHRSKMAAMHALVQSFAHAPMRLAGVVLNDR